VQLILHELIEMLLLICKETTLFHIDNLLSHCKHHNFTTKTLKRYFNMHTCGSLAYVTAVPEFRLVLGQICRRDSLGSDPVDSFSIHVSKYFRLLSLPSPVCNDKRVLLLLLSLSARMQQWFLL
jgi:hypothetical protein